MNSQRIRACEPSGGSSSINLRKRATQSTGAWREIALWLLLAAFLLMLLADAAYAAERVTSSPTRLAEAGVPTYNIEAICRGAASIARLLETTAPDNTQGCIDDERRAREQLVKEWSQFDAADRVMCHGAARSGTVEPAYTELMTCLEITRDNHAREASAQVARQQDQPQAPGAVTAAPVQRLGSIRNAFAVR